MANNKLPFGLCKKFNIDLPSNATPKDAWEALKKRGITPNMISDGTRTNPKIEAAKKKSVETLKREQSVYLGLDFFSNKSKSGSIDVNNERPTPPKEAYGFASKERLNTAHHIKHAEEMGYKNQKEYEQAAIEFWNSGAGKVYYSAERKRYYKYDNNTERFISVCDKGSIHTFMKYPKNKFTRKITQEHLYVY